MNTIRDRLMIVDKSGTIVSVNKALEDITGFSNDELIGSLYTVLNCNIFKKAPKNTNDHWCALFKSGRFRKRRCTIIKKDQSVLNAVKNACLLHDDNGEVSGAMETITDISDIIEKDNQIKTYRRELRSEDGFQGIIGTSKR